MIDIRGLSYFVAESADPVQWQRYATDVLGMMVSEAPAGGLYVKMDERPFRMLIVPGGVVDAAAACPATRAWVAQAAGAAQITASVCTGAFILAAAGVLTEGPATTHWEDIADLRTQYPALDVLENLRWVDRGALVTSAGISAGIDMSLHLVTRLLGAALSERTARQMDTPWNPEP